MKEKGTLSSSIHESSITLIQNQTDSIKSKNYRTASLINIDVKIFNETLANRIQQCVKTVMPRDQVGFIPEMQGWLNII